MGSKSLTLSGTLHSIKCDAARYGNQWKYHPGFWVSLSYRVRRLRKHGGIRHYIFLPIDIIVGLIRRVISDTAIPSAISVGKGVYLPHPNGIIISHKTKIGNGVAIFQQVTIGEWHNHAPIIGDGTAIYSGAKIFGKVLIGCDCRIGANVVVNADIPDNTSVSTGNPILRQRGISQEKSCL